ncbi:MAG: B12-binding domain-containing protein [bacterium]
MEPIVMSQQQNIERLFESLITGNRDWARRVVRDAGAPECSAKELLSELFWPTHELIEKLHRADQIDQVAYHLSTRLLRPLVDQASAQLPAPTSKNRTIFAACGPSQSEELGAQIAVDLLESAGFEVTFAGGGVPGDEILAQVQQRQPDYLLLFCSAPSDLPGIREIVDQINEIGACGDTKIVVGGGVFNRAEGLAEEMGISMCVTSPMEAVEKLPGAATPKTKTATTGAARRRRAVA